jgi:fructokinase
MTAGPFGPVDVLVVGESLMDIVYNGSVTTEHPGGSPANVALGLGRRGVDVAFLTDLGRDPRGRLIVRHLERSHVEVLGEFSDRPTSTATAMLGLDGSAAYAFDVNWRLSTAPLRVSATLVHTGSIAAFVEPGRQAVLSHLDRLGPRTVTFDPNIRPALLGSHATALDSFRELAARADVVKMSDEDAAWLYPTRSPAEVAHTVGHFGPRLVVITHGSRGATLTTADAQIHVPAVAATVADTIGAGDTYMVSLIVDVLALQDWRLDEETVAHVGARAARAASVTVSRAGANLPWAYELDGPVT